MEHLTHDHAEIIHFAGRHQLSPALDAERRPAFGQRPGEDLVRCGWEPFFAAMTTLRLDLHFDPDDPSSARFVSRVRAVHPPRTQAFFEAAREARRFLRALFGRTAR